ncbi:hypothetical protein [Prosthecochloris sp.]|uniref:hypothetical protein n=1 Tax=Prosthecochloris sp. TaxID=290513 RepID=UPI0025FAF684|nr:hypothetical protein [Prosthecochloris sp.]
MPIQVFRDLVTLPIPAEPGQKYSRGCLVSPIISLSVVILGLDPGMHLPMKVSVDAASSAA